MLYVRSNKPIKSLSKMKAVLGNYVLSSQRITLGIIFLMSLGLMSLGACSSNDIADLGGASSMPKALPSNIPFALPAPTVSGVSPAVGVLAGGTTLTITGTGFVAGATVLVGNSLCDDVQVQSSTTISCVLPSSTSVGGAAISVTNVDTQSSSLVNAFSYNAPPTVDSISPSSGFAVGGNSVTIAGTGFAAGATVTVGGNACSNVSVNSSTSISCTAPTGTGAQAIVVTNSDSLSGSLSNGYSFVNAPTVSSVSPSSGYATGGTSITISGSGFISGSSVTVGGSTCSSVIINSSSSISCTAPIGSGSGSVIVTNPDTQTGTLSSAYTFVPSPVISTVSPSAGALGGGTTITLTGTGFLSNPSITVGGSTCGSVNVISSTSLTCVTPAGSGLKNVVLQNSDFQSYTKTNSYTYQAAPTVSSFTPAGGLLAAGTTMTVTGTGFLSGATVSVGGQTCTNVVVVNSTTITCTAPGGTAGNATVSVSNSDGQGVSAGTSYVFTSTPVVTSISPTGGPQSGGTAVTITGYGFSSVSGVTIGVAATSVNMVSNTSVTAVTGNNGSDGARNVVVTNGDSGTGTLTNGFTFAPPPSITNFSPTSAPAIGGATLTITGTNFNSGATVAIGGTTCTSPQLTGSTQITCILPAHTAGSSSVVVTNTDSQSDTEAGFTFKSLIFTANMGSDTLSAFLITPTNGDLTAHADSPYALGTIGSPTAILPLANGKFALGVYKGTTRVVTLDVSNTTGGLSYNNVQQTYADPDPIFIAADPASKFAYVVCNAASNSGGVNATHNGIIGYTVNSSTGALTPINGTGDGSKYNIGNSPELVVISPNGNYLYGIDSASSKVYAFSIHSTTGALTAINNYSTGSGSVGPKGAVIHPNGNFLYVVNKVENTVRRFSIGGDGSLTDSGVTIATGTSPNSAAIDKNGSYLMVANVSVDAGGNSISSYTINSSTGALTAAPASPITTLPGGGKDYYAPEFVAVDPTGSYVFAAGIENTTTNQTRIAVYTIAVNGNLTLSTSASNPFNNGASATQPKFIGLTLY